VTITSEAQLETLLAQPSEADARAMAELDGDLMILGVSGKMGPSLAHRAALACAAAGVRKRIIGVARFSSLEVERQLHDWGVETIAADLLEPGVLQRLPDVPNLIYMAARKFGSTGNEGLTWAMNTHLPGLVADRFRGARIVAFSSGNVYPLTPVLHGGPTEAAPAGPVGEYAQSVLGRERVFAYYAQRDGTRVVLLRLNYAIDMRYGVLLDIGRKVFERRPVDLRMGHANVIWQGDANSVCLRAFPLCAVPPAILNLTGPETVAVRWAARRFADHFGMEPIFEGAESDTALLSNASRCQQLFGYPTVSVEQLIEWTAAWIQAGGASWNKPTHFEARDGKF